MENENEVLSSAVEETAAVVTNDSAVTDLVADDAVDTGHKVVFYIILGLIGLSGVGIPVLVFLLVKEHKKRKQVEEALAAKETPATETPAEEKKEEAQETKEEKKPEKK